MVVRCPEGTEETRPAERAYFKGHLEGDPSSLAVVRLSESSGPRGWIATNGRWLTIVPGAAAAPPEIRETELALEPLPVAGFCAAGSLDDLPPRGLSVGKGR